MNSLDFQIDLDSRVAVNPNLVLRVEDDDCALLFDPDSGQVQMLNDTAVAVWQLLDGKRSLREVLTTLQESFDGMGDDADEQVIELITSLAQVGAIGLRKEP